MAYSKYKNIQLVVQKFGTKAIPSDLFKGLIVEIQPSDWLLTTLNYMSSHGFDTEKERSERLISPILTEFLVKNQNQITLYSGHELNVKRAEDLNGECDYLLTLGNKVPDYVDKPIFSIVEAKRQDFELGTGQCAAQMLGAKLYNDADGVSTSFIYGAATDGVKWRFLKFENNTFFIDSKYYVTENLPELLGVLQYIFEDCKKNLLSNAINK